jgi:hypothetical protein
MIPHKVPDNYRSIPIQDIDWKLHYDGSYFIIEDLMSGGMVTVDEDDIFTLENVISIIKETYSCEYCAKFECNCEERIDDGIQNNENR